jgi:hypothetical protein
MTSLLNVCIFVVWMVFVVWVGVAFLLWAWRRGDLRIAAGPGGTSVNGEPEDATQPTVVNCSLQTNRADG